jgi:putative FmdB family regulatory protein
MPIYAYRCEDCGHAQDFLQKMSDPLIAVCPNCGSGNFKKQLTAAGFQLKGGGWYVTDFRDNGKKDGKKGDAATTAVAPAAEGGASGGEGKSGSSGDSKGGESSTPAAAPAASSNTASTSTPSASSTPSTGTKAA